MGINFDGVNPEVKAKLEKIVADGKISADEVKGLTNAEKDALAKGLGGVELPKTGEIKLSEPKVEKEEKGFWGKLWDGVKEFAGTTAGKVVIGGVATLAGVAAVAATFGTGTAIAVGVMGGLLTLQSCTPGHTDVNQDVTFNLTVESSDAEIIAQLKQLNGNLKLMLAELMKIGVDIDRMVELLMKMGQKVDDIIVQLIENGYKSDQIIGLIIKNNYMQEEILNKMTEGFASNEANQEEIKGLLAKIVDLVNQGNQLSAQNNELLTQILAKMVNMSGDEAASLLKEILAKLTESVEQNKDMDTKTHILLKEIIERMDKMDAGMQQGFSKIIAMLADGNKISEAILDKITKVLDKLDKMNQTNKNAFNAILNAINNLGEGTDKKLDAILNAILEGNTVTAAQLDEIRKLIVENNKIAQGTQDMIAELKNSMSEEHKAILDKLGQGNASLDEIKELLKAIKDGVDYGNVQLVEINDKLNVVGAVINNILANVDGIKDETKAILLQILAKIPNGCTCSDIDLSAVLEKLDEILEELKKDPQDNDGDTNHEGILNDLDKYFK